MVRIHSTYYRRHVTRSTLVLHPACTLLVSCNHRRCVRTLCLSLVVSWWGRYKSPELILHSRTYNSPVDMWACGCVLGELLTGVSCSRCSH